MSIFVEILVSIGSYGPQIDQSHGENRLSHIINKLMDPRGRPRVTYVACWSSNNIINMSDVVGSV